jgi:hypothetical protein
MLILRKEIKNEIDPSWSIEIKQQILKVCKDFDEEVIFEAYLSISVKLLQYINLCMLNVGVYIMKKVFPFFFFSSDNTL